MIRKYEKKDKQRLLELWMSCNEKAHAFIDVNYFMHYLPIYETSIDSDNCRIFVYEKNSVIYGYIHLMHNYIVGLFVDNEQQKKGIGHKLLTYAKNYEQILHLNVFSKNIKALSFYKNEGFIVKHESFNEEAHEFETSMTFSS